MLEEVNFLVETAQEAMEKALDHLHKELGKITTGKATPAIVKDLLVNYYGTPTPMNQVANISTSDARSLVIQPWEKSSRSVSLLSNWLCIIVLELPRNRACRTAR